MMSTWTLLLLLNISNPTTLSVPDKPIEPTHSEQAPTIKDFGIGETHPDPNLGGITLTMRPVPQGVEKMTGVEANTNVYVPSAVQIRFPSKEGCEAAAKAAETKSVGHGICLEIR